MGIKISNLPSATLPLTGSELVPVVQSGVTAKAQIFDLLSGSNGSASVGFVQAGTGATSRTTQAKLRDVVSVKDFGATGDGTTDDTVAIQAALADAVTNNRCLYFPAGTYLVTSNLTVPTPANVQRGFTILGENKHNGSIINFSGAAVTTGLTFSSSVSVYQFWGTISELQITCASGAKRGMTFTYAHAPTLVNVQFRGATQAGLYLDNCNQPVVEKCLFISNGSSGTAQLSLNFCTCFSIKDNYFAGSATASSGIDIDRSNTGMISNGAIESTGVPIRICEATEGTNGCNDITIQSVNIENPTNCYIRLGYGWTSTNGVKNVYILGCRGYVSGSTTALIGVDMKNCLGVRVVSCQFGLGAGATAAHNLSGTTNNGIFIASSRENFGASTPWVKVNAAQDVTATPYMDWSSDFGTNQLFYTARSATTSTLDNQIFAAQGGLYSSLALINAAPTTINRTAAIPSRTGTQITLNAIDANTTIAHLGGGGNGQFRNLSGANITMSAGQTLSYAYDGNTGNWSQI